MAPELEIICH